MRKTSNMQFKNIKKLFGTKINVKFWFYVSNNEVKLFN